MTDEERTTLAKIAKTLNRAVAESRLLKREPDTDTLETLVARNARITEAINGCSEEFLAAFSALLRDMLELEPVAA
jgi:hypothetical protein